MKIQLNTRTRLYVLAILLISVALHSCLSTSRMVEEKDVAYATRRIKIEYTNINYMQKSPLMYIEQSIVKEITSKNDASYKIFDLMVLKVGSYDLENKIFVIVDDNAYAMKIDSKEYEQSKSITENKTKVLTSDSTLVSVVTGYSENDKKITRFSYQLPEEVVDKIKGANKVSFQYYSGPNMMTVKIANGNLNKIKKLIDKE